MKTNNQSKTASVIDDYDFVYYNTPEDEREVTQYFQRKEFSTDYNERNNDD